MGFHLLEGYLQCKTNTKKLVTFIKKLPDDLIDSLILSQ